MADPQSYRPKDIPDSPGVYRFFNEKDVVIYVGKAISLKSRLNSYFQNNLAEKTRKMVNAAVRVDWTLVNTEVEALQLEFSWIKEENPHFNVQFKDDKSYPFLAVSIKDEFPRIYITRSQKQKGVKHIGPFAHAWALRSTYEVLLKLFPVRSCTESNFLRAQKSNRQCLLGDIGKCAAPCVGWVTPEEHHEIAKNLIKFLDSNPESVTEKLTDEMLTASAAEQFEKAAKLRDQLQALTKAQESTDAALSEEITADFIAMHEDITHAAFSIFIVRHGRITGSRSWVVDLQEVPEGDSVMDAALPKIYHDFEVPREILINQPITSEAGVIEWLSQKHGSLVEVKVPQRGEKFELLQTVKRNANQALIQFLSKRANDAGVSGRALEEIATALDLAELPLRIECFDISNIQGTSVVASMVVFEDGQSKKSEYRRFSIDDEAGFDDTRAMHHVITRRFKRYLAEKDLDLTELEMSGANRPKFAYPPQLIIVDGGVGQVNAAARALSELGITDIALCGLAKRLEEVWLPEVKTPVMFPRQITFHRSKRSKLMLESLLDEIPTLGTTRISALLEHFGSVSAIRKADESQISQIPGIGEKIAKIIVDFLAQQSAPENVNTSTGEIT
ncbi:MAG: excinuclease ABC subunit UvrC [Actinobacteria bacterium]|nr:excinuclease ABC subunit UvrC [Actinomycetota bacterium]